MMQGINESSSIIFNLQCTVDLAEEVQMISGAETPDVPVVVQYYSSKLFIQQAGRIR
jgi:hypothetical protein